MLVVDPHHWLTDAGELPHANPRLRKQILRVAQFIEAAGPLPPMHCRETLIACRRRPKRKPCSGLMWVVKTADHHIQSYCAVCREDEAIISNWQDTLWAEGPMDPVPVEQVALDTLN